MSIVEGLNTCDECANAVQIIEKAFGEVMKKEPERQAEIMAQQAKLRAQEEEARKVEEKERRQNELRREAEERKRIEIQR